MNEFNQRKDSADMNDRKPEESRSSRRQGSRRRGRPREQEAVPNPAPAATGQKPAELVSAVAAKPNPPAALPDDEDDFGVNIFPVEPSEPAAPVEAEPAPVSAAPAGKAQQTSSDQNGRSRRRRGSRGRGRARHEQETGAGPLEHAAGQSPARSTAAVSPGRSEAEPPRPDSEGPAGPASQPGESNGIAAGKGETRQETSRRRRRRSRGRGGRGDESSAKPELVEGDHAPPVPFEEEEEFEDEEAPRIAAGDRVMLINVSEGEECRIAILHKGRLEELFFERASGKSHVGNIYKGRVTNVEPSIQAAFVDFGFPRNGFLHISDLQPQYFPSGMRQTEEVGRKTPRRDRPPIQKCLRRGQEIIVQIIKEGIGTKGPTLTSYISIPGRYLVMMPGMNRLGVSRRIEDEELRRKMRRALEELDLPKDMGFILRTAGSDRTKRELQRDLNYLQRLWKLVARRIKNDRAPCELYQESDLVIRTIRDIYSSDFNRIVVDSEEMARKVRDFLSIAMPRASVPVEVYAGPLPLFHKYGIESEIENLYRREVPLPSGGSLVIDSTEAMVAIDVNSGRYREHSDAEETAFRTNMEAAEEIARQLRLRDLGGLILCDFIDMRQDKHIRAVERAVREALRKHKERAKCLRMSQFGIMEITRQRMRPSIKRSIYQDCPCCHGTGMVKNAESMTLDVIRLLKIAVHHDQTQKVSLRVPPSVAFHLQNHKRDHLHLLEKDTGVQIIIHGDRHMNMDQYVIECFDRRGGVIKLIESSVGGRTEPSAHARRQQEAPPKGAPEGFEAIEDVFD